MSDWRSKLNKSEKAHLRESKIRTKGQMISQINFLKEEMSEHPKLCCPCYECLAIGRKLGLLEEVQG